MVGHIVNVNDFDRMYKAGWFLIKAQIFILVEYFRIVVGRNYIVNLGKLNSIVIKLIVL